MGKGLDGYDYAARVLKALAHPVRLRILEVLTADEQVCVCHLENLLQLRQAYLSQQLAILRKAGLVRAQREGMNVYYTLTSAAIPAGLRDIQQLAARLAEREGQTLRFEAAHGNPDEPCPCPRCHAAVESPESERLKA